MKPASQICPSWISPSPSITQVRKAWPRSFAPSAIPTPGESPWPSDPVDISSPGSASCPGGPAGGSRRVERVQLRDREIAAHGEHGVESDRGVPLAEDEAVSLRPIRMGGIDVQRPESRARPGCRSPRADRRRDRLRRGESISRIRPRVRALNSSERRGLRIAGFDGGARFHSNSVTEIGAMGGCALGRIAFAGVLLDDDPAIESLRLQEHDGRNIDHPAPERAEDDLAQGIGEAPALLPRPSQDAGSTSLRCR